MARTLKALIKASGNAGVAGQSFLNHVTGAVSGGDCDMKDYNVDFWTFVGDQPIPAPLGGSYPNGQAFALDIEFTQGSRATHIKRTGAVLILTAFPTDGTSPGASGTLTTNLVVAAATGSQVAFFITSVYDSNSTGGHTPVWFRDYPPGTPPSHSDPEPVRFAFQLTGMSSSGTHGIDITLSYVPDIGAYNPTLITEWLNIPFADRVEAITDFDVEWHNNSSYTDLHGAGYAFDYMSSPLSTVSYWMRYKRKTTGTWTNYGEVPWEDPRIA